MVSLAKVLLTIATSLSIKWFCEATVSQVNQTPNYLNNPFAEYLSQRGKYESDTLNLKEFAFDEISAKQFSDTFSELQHLTLDGCDINNELISLLTLPSSLKSIRLERLNLSSKEIQSILDKLSPSLESLEVIDCLFSKFSHQELQSNSTAPKESLNLLRFPSLKNISINNLGNNFDLFNLLLSLLMLPLERIKLSCAFLSTVKWIKLLKNWTTIVEERKNLNQVTFFNSLKEFDLKIERIDDDLSLELVKFLFSFPYLENISLETFYFLGDVSLPPPPSNIKQLSLSPFGVYMKEDGTSLWNPKNLPQLTHLSVNNRSKIFPNFLFDLKQLEYLKIRIWENGDISSVTDQCCSRLKYLSIQSQYLIPLLANFENNFPEIETLEIKLEDSDKFNSYLKTIISSKTLKCLKIKYFDNTKCTLKIEGELKSSIEELKLENVYWDFVSDLEPCRFPCLKKLDIKQNNYLNLEDVLKTLSSFPQLTSLTLSDSFRLPNEKLSFRLENLKFFCLYSSEETIDLDILLSCMPNLIEFQLKGEYLIELKLQNPIGIRYLELPHDSFENNGDFINVIKNTTNLIQLTTEKYLNIPIQSISYAPELAYYFKELKKHFNDELQFKVHPNSFPIKLLKNDVTLEKLVSLKSLELPNYLKHIFPITTFKLFVEQLFTIDIEKYFGDKPIDYKLMKLFFNLLGKIESISEKDILSVAEFLVKGKIDDFTESTGLSPDHVYKLFLDYLTSSIETELKSVHLEFIEEFFKANMNYGLFKIFIFLKSFFTSLSIANSESKIINDEIFYLFTGPLLTSSFSSLFYRIKKSNVDSFRLLFNGIEWSEEEKKSLPLKLESIAEELKKLTPEQYEKLCTHFKDIFIEVCDDSFADSLFNALRGILIPKTECAICLDSLFNEKCMFFKSKDGNCHLFHRDCLNEWLKEKNTCPQCRRTN